MSANIFRKCYSIPVPAGAAMVTIKGVPSARFKRNGKTVTAPLTTDGQRVRIRSPYHYGWVNGKEVRLYTDAIASQQRLAELIRKSERDKTDLADPFDQHRLRPLTDHLDDWRKSLSRGAGQTHVRHCVNNVRRILDACEFKFMRDISAARVEAFLVEMQRDRVFQIDAAKTMYTKKELAALLGINPTAVAPLLKRHRLAGEGNGKRRRYSKEIAEALCDLRRRGHSIKTGNLYLDAIKTFCRWLVSNQRMEKSPVQHLAGGNVKEDRRHDRRILDEAELRRVLDAARESAVSFRGLTGPDRAILYGTACVTGFRASELASLCPDDFDMAGEIAKVTLSARYAKNSRTVEQPLPPTWPPRCRPTSKASRKTHLSGRGPGRTRLPTCSALT